MNPLADQPSLPQPQGNPQGNPLSRLAAPLPGLPPRQPQPTAAQTTAAVRRFGAVMEAMRSVMSSPGYGHTNVRPKILDEASKLMASRLLSLPEIMASVGQVPDDPLSQKEHVEAIFNAAKQAEAAAIDHHGSAVATGKLPRDGGEKYDPAHHERHMTGLLQHYPKV